MVEAKYHNFCVFKVGGYAVQVHWELSTVQDTLHYTKITLLMTLRLFE